MKPERLSRRFFFVYCSAICNKNCIKIDRKELGLASVKMEDPLHYPTDRESADAALARFPEFAANLEFSSYFEEALRIIYGRNYSITTDYSRRMNFHCEVCRKTMNGLNSLNAHDSSGSHVKNADKSGGQFSSGVMKYKAAKYPHNSLQYAILQSHAMILGAHLIEGYSRNKRAGAKYFKCLLCGSHGHIEAMIHHVKNDKHTDRYIRFSFQCNVRAFSLEVRNTLRLRAFEREGVRVEDIITIEDESLYPDRWEDESLSVTRLRRKQVRAGSYGGRNPSSSSRSRCVSVERSSLTSFKRKASEDQVGRVVASFLRDVRNHQGYELEQSRLAARRQRFSRPPMRDQAVQVFFADRIEKVLRTLTVIIRTTMLPGSEVASLSDAKSCIRHMFSVGCLLYQAVCARAELCSQPAQRQLILQSKESIAKAQGCVVHALAPDLEIRDDRLGSCLGDIIKMWDSILSRSSRGELLTLLASQTTKSGLLNSEQK